MRYSIELQDRIYVKGYGYMADSESFKYKVKITGKTPDNGNTKMLKQLYH